jgi:phosphonate transport system ATP-binding protein
VNDGLSSGAGVPAPAIAVRGLVKRFGTLPVIDGLDLTVTPGEAVSLIGANGTGKSTLLRLIVRLIEPDAGQVHLLGDDIGPLRGRALARLRSRVGFVFQRHNLVTRHSALTNVIHGVQARRSGPMTWHQMLARRADRAEALACLEAVGLADKAMQRADSLSGGQSQRVAIARVLMQRPQVILADEPDASLDPRAGEEVMGLLADLARDQGIALMFVSHHMKHAVNFADRVVGLADGRVAFDRPAHGTDPHLLSGFFTPEEERPRRAGVAA